MSASPRLLLGLDIGTSGVKGILLDETGKTLAAKTADYPMATPQPNWAEQHPEDWWNATIEVMKKLIREDGVYPERLVGVGLSGQMHTLVLLDRNNSVLRPAILWCDTRTDEECRKINNILGTEFLSRTAGNPAIEGFTLPKLLWVQQHEPSVYDKIHTVLLPKDYVRYKLTGEIATEVSDASATLLYDIYHRQWSSGIMERFCLPMNWLPRVVESSDICGKLSSEASKFTGFPAGVPVVGGGADNTCGAIGAGVINEGELLASIGTSGVVFAPINDVRVEKTMRVHTFCHSVPNRWYAM